MINLEKYSTTFLKRISSGKSINSISLALGIFDILNIIIESYHGCVLDGIYPIATGQLEDISQCMVLLFPLLQLKASSYKEFDLMCSEKKDANQNNNNNKKKLSESEFRYLQEEVSSAIHSLVIILECENPLPPDLSSTFFNSYSLLLKVNHKYQYEFMNYFDIIFSLNPELISQFFRNLFFKDNLISQNNSNNKNNNSNNKNNNSNNNHSNNNHSNNNNSNNNNNNDIISTTKVRLKQLKKMMILSKISKSSLFSYIFDFSDHGVFFLSLLSSNDPFISETLKLYQTNLFSNSSNMELFNSCLYHDRCSILEDMVFPLKS